MTQKHIKSASVYSSLGSPAVEVRFSDGEVVVMRFVGYSFTFANAFAAWLNEAAR